VFYFGNHPFTRDLLEFIISQIPINQKSVITIGLENNGVQKTLEYLNQNFDPIFDYSMVKNSTNFYNPYRNIFVF
jgi:hypothetical protein